MGAAAAAAVALARRRAAAAAAQCGANRQFPDPRTASRYRRYAPSADEPDLVEILVPSVSEEASFRVARYKKLSPLDSGPGAAGGAGGGIPDMKQDPLAWWQTRTGEFPMLSRVARKYLGIPAASAAAERMFSYTGLRVGKLNSNLDDDALLSLVFVRALSKFVARWGPQYLN